MKQWPMFLSTSNENTNWCVVVYRRDVSIVDGSINVVFVAIKMQVFDYKIQAHRSRIEYHQINRRINKRSKRSWHRKLYNEGKKVNHSIDILHIKYAFVEWISIYFHQFFCFLFSVFFCVIKYGYAELYLSATTTWMTSTCFNNL